MVIKLTNVSKVIKKAKVLDSVNLEFTSGKSIWFKGKEWLRKDNAYESYMRSYIGNRGNC